MAEKEIFSNQENHLGRQAKEKAARMSENQKANFTGTILPCMALIAAGLAGNYYKFPLFLNIDILFGSIFALLALQFFGLCRGVLAAAIIAGYTYILWNHPYAIFILTAEVAVVGWLMNRCKIGLVLADTLYWIIIGMPLVYLFYHVVMHVPFSNASIVMTKQAVNGIANALVARLIFIGFALRSRSSLTSYRDIIYNLLAFFVLVPTLIMLAIGSRTDIAETDLRIRTSLIQDSQHVKQRLETWVANRETAISNLAEMAASRTPEQMQSYLEHSKKSDVNFLRIGLLNKEATITAYFPLFDEQGKSNIGINFADRPFIPELKHTLRPMLSEVVMGKIGTPKPIVVILAPVIIQGEYAGYVTGTLSLEQIQEHLDRSIQGTMLYTLIDKNGSIIMTNRTDQKVATPFVRGSGTVNHLDSQISQWMPDVPPNTPMPERWKNTFYIAETTIGNLAEWKLILEQPVAPFQKTLNDNYTSKLIILFLILLVALILAELLSRWSIAKIDTLRLITHDLPITLSQDVKKVAWPESSIKEAKHLINNFREMADLLAVQFDEIRQINESLEQRVVERTEALRENESRLREVLENSQDASYKRNLQTNTYDYLSPVFARISGYTPDEMKDSPTETLIDLIHPADLPEFQREITESMSGTAGTAYQVEYRFKHKEGEYRWLLDRFNVSRDADGLPLARIGSMSDITEHKRADELMLESNKLLTLFVRHSPVYCYIKDVNSTRSLVLLASENYQDMIGIPGSEMVGKTMEELFPAEFAAKITADDWAVVSKGDVLRLDEELNGRSYTSIKFPIVLGDKTLLAGYTIDITERKQAEAEKEKMEARSRQLQKAESLGRMAGAIAHHFNNQLQVVVGNLEMALKDLPLESDISATLIEAMMGAHKAAEVSGLMLTYLGQTSDNLEPIDMSETCHLSIIMLQAAAPKGIILKADFPSGGPIIRSNASQIQQVLTNLLSNAWEAAGEDLGAITLNVKTVSQANIPASKRFPIDWQPQEGDYACLEVADAGCGIPVKDIEKIFDPFFTTKFTGRGLGLPVVLGIVKAHGGGVTVESEPGKGSVFRIYLPALVEEAPRQPEKSLQIPEIEWKGTVLVVEDEEMVRKLTATMLKHIGFTVLEAMDGVEALEVFQQHQDEICCVLTDLTMPRMDGWETLTALRKISPNIPVILSSGYDEAHVMAGEHTEQPNAFMGKPYQFKELRETISRVLADQ